MTARPNLLYVSPVFPDLTGNGLAMRAGMFLSALAERYNVYLLVVPIYDYYKRPISEFISRHCCRVMVIRPVPRDSPLLQFITRVPLPLRLMKLFRAKPQVWRYASRQTITEAASAFRDIRFDVIHVFRLYMTPFARPYLRMSLPRNPTWHLDLDDIESITRRSLAQIYRSNGDTTTAQIEESEASKYESLERDVLSQCDRIYVCSQKDKEELDRRYRCKQICVIPNAVHVSGPLPAKQTRDPFTFLFVGTLGYYPNEDALIYFCREIIPLIRRNAPCAFTLHIVGTGATARIRQLALLPEVKLIGRVPDVAPYYRDADAVVVPIRAGGGTRIKVLEAFSYGRPVVSTSVGIEGIAARDGEHVLVADAPAEFASHCLRLMADLSVAEALARNSFSLVTHAYTTEVVARSLAACS